MAKEEKRTRKNMRSVTPEKVAYPVRLTPENYAAVKNLADTTGQSMNFLFNAMVTHTVASQDPTAPTQTLQSVIAGLSQKGSETDANQGKGKARRKGDSKAKEGG